MAGVNDLIADLNIRHQVGVQRLGSSVVKQLMPILDRADADIVKKIMLRPADLENSFGTKRLKALLEAVRDIRHNAQIDFNKGLLKQLKSIATYESQFQVGMLQKAIPVVMDIVSPTSQMLQAAVTARPFQGALLKDWLTGMESGAVRRVREAITQGVIQGETVQDMIKRIRGTKANNYRDGLMATSRRGAETMVRTAVSHVTSVSRDLLYDENKDIIAKEQWVSTLDTRTCPQCQGLDGKTFEVGKGVRTPAHLACRCIRIPVLKSWREMGFDIDELEPGTRASMNGQVPANMNYNEWLRKQTADVQDEALGPTRGAMFREGNLKVDSFTNRAGDELTLDELRKKENIPAPAPAPVADLDAFSDLVDEAFEPFEDIVDTIPTPKIPEWFDDEERWYDIPSVSLTSDAISKDINNVYNALGVQHVNRGKLSKEEVAEDLFAAVRSYTGLGYESMNKYLRGQMDGRVPSDDVLDKIATLKKALAGQVTKRDTVLYRGIGGLGGLNDMPPPSDFFDLGFGSLSMNPYISTGFAGTTSREARVLFEIRTPKGVPALSISRMESLEDALNDEAEILMAPGTRYRYVSERVTAYRGDDWRVITLEIVSNDGAIL